jgi:oxygen-independent coproporphyrinogen-3 oxidase
MNHEMTDFGVYVHYPWCRKRCRYCAFPIALAADAEIPHQAYLEEVCVELTARAPDFTGRGLKLVSIYLGGGTPSLWPSHAIAVLLSRIRRTFSADTSALEVTIEANPVDCTVENVTAWRAAGVNRVSLGVQSLEQEELSALGRDHCMGDGARAIEVVLAGGFFSVSADIIMGAPGASGGLATVRTLAERGVPHLSVYELTLEAGTPLAAASRRGSFRPRSERALAGIYRTVDAELSARGYEHYEVSSYARPGHRAVHNRLYWRGCEYLGVGAGAASFQRLKGGGGLRSQNPRAVARYLRGERSSVRDRLSSAALAADLLWLGLRTAEGVSEESFIGRGADLKWLIEHGLARCDAGRIHPTLRGFLFADQVARRVVESSG